ncbi:RhoGAP-domain-containing protein [Hesseltinella vesiculosa]|uniref:RhoGAP-domain-containing protein n=1 Tax=Hesseltinella vesiculosa TaxID=101127 RepID=A0A1X2GHE4_9FUNG|nr:RhoGAP-domain-containing protein [Hesseltinella vesiculosa]
MTDLPADQDIKKKSKHSWLNLFKTKPFSNQNKHSPFIITGIFGAPLEYAAQCGTTTPSGLAVPDPVNRCFMEILARGLRVEGLFRLSGSVQEVDQLQYEFDQPPTYGKYLDLAQYDIHAITSLVKKYLRALPDPVIPFAYQPRFIHLLESRQPNQDDRQLVFSLAKLIKDELPTTHYHVMHYIVLVTSWVQHSAQYNRMNPEAMAVILAPICAGLEKSFDQVAMATGLAPLASPPSPASSAPLPTSPACPSLPAHGSMSSPTSSSISSNNAFWLPGRTLLHHLHAGLSSPSPPSQEQVELLLHKTGQWTTLWRLMIEHNDVLLDHWRQTTPTYPFSLQDGSDPLFAYHQRHSMPHPFWSTSTLLIPDHMPANPTNFGYRLPPCLFDDQPQHDSSPSSPLFPPVDPLPSIHPHHHPPQHNSFRRRPHLLGVAKDDEHIYLNTPSPPPLPIPEFHDQDIKPPKKPSLLLRRPKSIASLHPRFKTRVS